MRDMSRNATLGRLAAMRRVPVLIVGGGINGAGLFRDLALQGVDCLLVERGDIAAGASAAPSRMIHGGLRYLETGQLRLVRQGAYERNLLLRNAAHLVRPLKTVVPLRSRFGGLASALAKLARRNAPPAPRGAALVKAGLTLYDLAGARKRILPRHQMLGREAALSLVPALDPQITGAAIYWDAWIRHPERLNVELVLDALEAHEGAEAVTHAALTGTAGGRVRIADALSGEVFDVAPDLVVNATGAWIDRANAALGVATRHIGGTKGSHLVLNHAALHDALGGAMVLFDTTDGRTCLAFPFLGRVLAGTTDIRTDEPDGAHCSEAEERYILGILAEGFPRTRIGPEHIVYRYSGVRPLPFDEVETTGIISRDHSMPVDEADGERPFPVLSMVGGKWTTFRGFAAEAADEVLRRLGRARRIDTADMAIGGGRGLAEANERETWPDRAARENGRRPARLRVLFERYGTRAAEIAALEGAAPGMLVNLPGVSRAEIGFMAREEMVVRLDDLVLRRMLVAIRGDLTGKALDEIAAIAGEALGWDEPRIAAEIAATRRVLAERHGVRLATKPVR